MPLPSTSLRALLELVVVDEVEVGGVHALFVAGKGRKAPACVVDVGDGLAVGQDELEQTAEAVVAVARRVHLGAVPALALGVRGDGADLFYGFAEAAVVELLAAGGVFDADEAADLVGAVAFEAGVTVFVGDVVGGVDRVVDRFQAVEVVVVADRLLRRGEIGGDLLDDVGRRVVDGGGCGRCRGCR